MTRRTPISPKAMAAAGWTRVDPRPWKKCGARWRHASGWTLEHCGHPTANWPWDLHDPQGNRVRSGVLFGRGPDRGYAWATLAQAVEYVAGVEARGAVSA